MRFEPDAEKAEWQASGKLCSGLTECPAHPKGTGAGWGISCQPLSLEGKTVETSQGSQALAWSGWIS